MVKKVNLLQTAEKIKAFYDYVRIGTVNDHMLHLVKVKDRTLDFHIHADSDELFCILEGSMQIEFEDGLVSLGVGDMLIVPKGTPHRPVCTVPVTCLQIEAIGTLSNENCGGTYDK